MAGSEFTAIVPMEFQSVPMKSAHVLHNIIL